MNMSACALAGTRLLVAANDGDLSSSNGNGKWNFRLERGEFLVVNFRSFHLKCGEMSLPHGQYDVITERSRSFLTFDHISTSARDLNFLKIQLNHGAKRSLTLLIPPVANPARDSLFVAGSAGCVTSVARPLEVCYVYHRGSATGGPRPSCLVYQAGQAAVCDPARPLLLFAVGAAADDVTMLNFTYVAALTSQGGFRLTYKAGSCANGW